MRKRSKYRPKPIISPLDYLQPTGPAQLMAHMLPIYTALECIASGKEPGTEEWRHLSDCVNITEQLCKMGHLPADTQAIANDAIAALVRASVRYKNARGMRLDSDGIRALRTCVGVYDQATTLLPQAAVYKAQCAVIRRTAAILRGGAPRDGLTIVQM